MLAGIASLWASLRAKAWFMSALKWGGILASIALTILFQFKRAEKAARSAGRAEVENQVLRQRAREIERIENVQAQMDQAGADKPRSRNDLAQRMRDGTF